MLWVGGLGVLGIKLTSQQSFIRLTYCTSKELTTETILQNIWHLLLFGKYRAIQVKLLKSKWNIFAFLDQVKVQL